MLIRVGKGEKLQAVERLDGSIDGDELDPGDEAALETAAPRAPSLDA